MIPTAFDTQPKYDKHIGQHHVVKLNLMPEDKTKVQQQTRRTDIKVDQNTEF